MKLLRVFVFLVALNATTCFAVEIKNSNISIEDSTIQLTYDLYGKPGEKRADVKFAVTIDGERYKPGRITVEGDFGNNIPVGLGKKIKWNLLKDMPSGYTGTVSVELDAESSSSNDPLKLSSSKKTFKQPFVRDNTIIDPMNKLVWTRSPLALKQTNNLEVAKAMISNLNQKNYIGYSDWRLPTKNELYTLFKLMEMYGYKSGQSALPYMSKAGFDIGRESKFWTIDKSSTEFTGKEYFVSANTNYNANSTTNRSLYASSPYQSGRYTGNSNINSSGSGALSGSIAIKNRDEYSGLNDLYIDTKDGYFYKHNGSDRVNILAVRGDGKTDIYAVNSKIDVSITPK